MARDAGTLSTFGAALHQAGGGEFARESYLAEHLPYFGLTDDDVMVLREGDLLATLRLDGLNPMTSEDARLDALKRAVAAIVAQTGNAFGFYIHRISVPQDLGMRPIEGDSFAAAIDARWQSHVKDLRPAKRLGQNVQTLAISCQRLPSLLRLYFNTSHCAILRFACCVFLQAMRCTQDRRCAARHGTPPSSSMRGTLVELFC